VAREFNFVALHAGHIANLVGFEGKCAPGARSLRKCAVNNRRATMRQLERRARLHSDGNSLPRLKDFQPTPRRMTQPHADGAPRVDGRSRKSFASCLPKQKLKAALFEKVTCVHERRCFGVAGVTSGARPAAPLEMPVRQAFSRRSGLAGAKFYQSRQ